MALDDTTRMIFEAQFKSNGAEQMGKGFDILAKRISTLSRNLTKNMKKGFEDIVKIQKVNNKISEQASKNTDKYRHAMMGLRRSMIAFFFITRELGGMMAPAAQLVGIFDVWNTILTITFLPAMIWLQEKVFVPMLKTVGDLNPIVKDFIGALGLIGLTLGTLNMLSVLSGFGTLADLLPKLGIQLNSLEGLLGALSFTAGIGFSIYAIKLFTDIYNGKDTWNNIISSWTAAAFGGAFIGFQYGGPDGAIIGATIGFAVGVIFSVFAKGASEKAKLEKMIRDQYSYLAEGHAKETLIKSRVDEIWGSTGGTLGNFFSSSFDNLPKTVETKTTQTTEVVKNAGSSMKNIVSADFNEMGDMVYTFDDGTTETLKNGYTNKLNNQTTYQNNSLSSYKQYTEDMISFAAAANNISEATSLYGQAGAAAYASTNHGKGSYVVNTPNGTVTRYNDMIWRAGSPPVAISPDDNIVASKKGSGGGIGGGVNVTQNIYVTASNKDEISRMIKSNNQSLVMDIKRLVGA